MKNWFKKTVAVLTIGTGVVAVLAPFGVSALSWSGNYAPVLTGIFGAATVVGGLTLFNR